MLSFYSELNSPVPTETVDITHYNFVADVKTSPDSRFAIRATQCVRKVTLKKYFLETIRTVVEILSCIDSIVFF